ncbi:hypothetical protein ABRZ79_04860 [Vibrio vulnificus]|nr:hypothetical protein [Vibrio parahaemolyticus]HDY7968040.1 hypothetical protein [Vibrio vulnificus]
MNEITFGVNDTVSKWLCSEAKKAGASVPAFVRKIIKEKKAEEMSKNENK